MCFARDKDTNAIGVEKMDPAIFKAYDIRGIYPDQIDEEDAWKVGCAAARFLRSLLSGYERDQAKAQSLCVGRALRTHSESLTQALIEGMKSTGTNVIDIGMIDTPQMYFTVNPLGICGSVQVATSNNPTKYNGFKISGLFVKPFERECHMSKVILTKKPIHLGDKIALPQESKSSDERQGQGAGNSETLLKKVFDILISGEKIPFNIVLVVIGFIFIRDNEAGRLRNWRDLFWIIQKCSFPLALYLVFIISRFSSRLNKKRHSKTTKKQG
ncbi:MAG TPA: hypothetical protein VMW72_01885 [Sedimentisphaerales bacterium]|nr:hypothetical protein [Sedimentisphaerales bacterium]